MILSGVVPMFAALLLAATPTAPVPTGVQPVGPPPRVYFVRAASPGDLRVYARYPTIQKVTKTIQVQVNGVNLPKTVTEDATVFNNRVSTLAATGGRFERFDGQAVSAETLAQRVQTGTVVIVPADGQPIHPIYRPLFRPDALVLTVSNGGYPVPTNAGLSGTAPLLLRLTPDADGVVRLPVATLKTETQKVKVNRVVNGQVQAADEERTVTYTAGVPTAVSDAQVTGSTVGGKKLDVARLSAGGLVLTAGPSGTDDAYLSVFAADVPVLRSPTLVVGDPLRPTGQQVLRAAVLDLPPVPKK